LKYDQLLFLSAPCLCFGLAEAGFSGLKCGALLCRDGTALQSIYRCNWGVQPVHNLMPRNRAVNPAGNVEHAKSLVNPKISCRFEARDASSHLSRGDWRFHFPAV